MKTNEMTPAGKLTLSALMAALAVVIMVLGRVIGIGTYAAPILACLVLIPVGRECGARYQIMVWLAAGILSLLLISDAEQSLIFLCLFGWYPILRPRLEKLPLLLRWCVKMALFNAVLIGVEALVMLLLVPETESWWMLIALLLMANATFVIFDFVFPRVEIFYDIRLRRHIRK